MQSALGAVTQSSAVPLPANFSATFGRSETKVVIVKSTSDVHTEGTIIVPR